MHPSVVVGRGGNCRTSRGTFHDHGDGAARHLVKGDIVTVDVPLSADGQVLSRHRGGQCRIPAGEGVTLFGRVGDGGDGSAEGVGLSAQHIVAVHVGEGVLVGRECGGDGHIAGGHEEAVVRGLDDRVVGVGDYEVAKGVAVKGFHRELHPSVVVGRGGNCRTSRGTFHDHGDGAARHLVKGDIVTVDVPLSADGQVLSRHRGGQLRIPSVEGVSLFCRGGDGSDSCTEGKGVDNQHVVAVHVGDGVGVGGEVGNVVTGFGHREGVFSIGNHILTHGPVHEGVSFVGRGRQGGVCAVFVLACTFHRSALCRVGGGGDVVLVGLPLGLNRQVFSGHRGRQLGIPSSKGIAFLDRIGHWNNGSANGEGVNIQYIITIHVGDSCFRKAGNAEVVDGGGRILTVAVVVMPQNHYHIITGWHFNIHRFSLPGVLTTMISAHSDPIVRNSIV